MAPTVLGALAVVSLTAMACSSTGNHGENGGTATVTHLLHFKFAALNASTAGPDSTQFIQGQPCMGIQGDSDLVNGAQVIIKNGSGSIIATTTLTGGTANNGACEFNVSTTVPQTGFYQITIGQGHGSTTYSLAQLKAANWHPAELSA